MRIRIPVAALSILSAAGCASMQEMYQQSVCNENGGYTQGMNDARSGEPMNAQFAHGCEGASREIAQKAYRDGYEAGVKGSSATTINIDIGGRRAPRKNFLCKVRAFTETYSGWGATELEARETAQTSCMKKHHEMHCDDFECERAR